MDFLCRRAREIGRAKRTVGTWANAGGTPEEEEEYIHRSHKQVDGEKEETKTTPAHGQKPSTTNVGRKTDNNNSGAAGF